MKQEKTYEEKIADIKKYLQTKETEVANNRKKEVRTNPLSSTSTKPKISTSDSKKTSTVVKEEKVRTKPKAVTTLSSSKKKDVKVEKKEVKKVTKPVSTSTKKSSPKKKTNTKEVAINNPFKTISNVCLFILPIFIFFSVVSIHTTYLVRKPINYASMIMCVILLICTIIFKVKAKKISKKKTNLPKTIITILTVTILDSLFIFLFIKCQMWNMIDKILENRLVFILIIMILIVLFIIIRLLWKMKNIRMKKSAKNTLYTVIATLYVLLYIDGLVVLYGPSKAFEEWIITTAMQTMNHQYLCKWFYSEEQIEYIMSQNYVLESGESTNPDLINMDKERVVYDNEYEEAVLKKEHKDDPYKIIKFEVNGCKAYLAVIYDPTTVKVATTSKLGVAGQYVTTMAENNNALLAINGGGFYDPGNNSAGGTPTGITIVDGKIVTNGEYGTNVQGGGIIGLDSKGVLYLLKNKTAQEAINMGITNAVSWGPFLIVNGEASFIKGNGGWGYAARTAIGQREDGIILFLVVDSNATRTNGADMVDLTEIMQNYGAINAANLDGGTSSVMVLPKKEALNYRSDCTDNYCYINDPIDGGLYHSTRAIADAFIVVKK